MTEVIRISARRPALSGPDLAAYEEACFKTYQDAFHRNAADPNLRHAIALVRAWNDFAVALGIEPMDTDGVEK